MANLPPFTVSAVHPKTLIRCQLIIRILEPCSYFLNIATGLFTLTYVCNALLDEVIGSCV